MNRYVLPAFVCGVTASRVRIIPTTPTNENGVVIGMLSSFSCKPFGFVFNVMVTFRGRISTEVVVEIPPESVTFR